MCSLSHLHAVYTQQSYICFLNCRLHSRTTVKAYRHDEPPRERGCGATVHQVCLYPNVQLSFAEQYSDVFSNPPIIVKIGAEAKTYYISKALIMQHSGYFKAAFGSDRFEEGASGEVSNAVLISRVLHICNQSPRHLID